MKKIIRRALTILPAVLLQLVWIYTLLQWLAPWAALLNMLLSILAFLFVLYIITKQDEGVYKILWLLVILTFPLPGAALYAFFGDKRTTRPLRKKLEAAVIKPQKEDLESAAAYGELSQENPRMAQIFRYIQNTTGFPVYANEDAQYYPLGDELFPAMLAELERAERFIFAEYFIVKPGVMWDSMVEIMARKAAQGVTVRVLFDDLGSISTYAGDNVRMLWKKGIPCVPFNPLIFVKGTLNYRDHRKMLVVDGRTAFSGGVNLADEYINQDRRFGHWKDIGFRLTGPAVQNYTRMFAEFWNAFAAEPVPMEFLAPPENRQRTGGQGYVVSYYDSPLRTQAVSNEVYIDLLSQAKDSAYFFTPYLLPGEALLNAFVRAARRGVDVRILMPGIPDKKLVFRMSHSFYPVLLKAGVRIFEYTPGFVHAKGCVIDGMAGTIGTVNLDCRSLFLHFENNSLFYGAPVLRDLEADFLNTQSRSREMRLGENVKVNLRHWMMDGILRIFAPLC